MSQDKTVSGRDEYESPEDRFEHDIEELESPSWHRNKVLIGLVLVIVVLVGAGITYLFMTEKKQVKPTGPLVMSIDVLEPRPGKLSNTPSKFRWETVSKTKYYSFVLSLKGTDMVLTQRASNTPSVTLTPEERDRLLKGKSYTFKVQAFSDTGSILGRAESSFDL